MAKIPQALGLSSLTPPTFKKPREVLYGGDDNLRNARENLSPALCYKAYIDRDSRYDGAFFIAVRTTRVYCRTTCKSRKANFHNCSFHPDSKSAEEQEYRPCLRCRPDLAPYSPPDAVGRLASAAIRLINDGALSEGTVEQLAKELGVTSRHLRRALQREYLQSPIELAQSDRLQRAERLIVESDLAITEIAAESRFSSIRRFNEAFREKYGINPSELRRLTRTVKRGNH